jgi:hypothetical protein
VSYLVSPSGRAPYGEWGCHACLPWEAGATGLPPAEAQRQAREHLGVCGHDVYVTTGSREVLHAVRTEAPAT